MKALEEMMFSMATFRKSSTAGQCPIQRSANSLRKFVHSNVPAFRIMQLGYHSAGRRPGTSG